MPVVQPLRRMPSMSEQAMPQGPYDALVRPDGMVHRTLFTDPAIFDQEMVRIFGGTWVFLLHETEIPLANDFKCINVGRRPVIVTRTADGEIRALMNRCTHRGTTLCMESHGNAKRFQCAYHGWAFTTSGPSSSKGSTSSAVWKSASAASGSERPRTFSSSRTRTPTTCPTARR